MSKYDVTIARDRYIGGSDVPIIMGLSPFKTRWQLLCEKSGKEVSAFNGNVYTEYGHIMEPKIREYINHTLHSIFEETEIIDGHRRYHADGYDGMDGIVLEIKTTSHIYENVEDYKAYLVQLTMGMVMHNTDFGRLAVYERPDDFNEEFDPKRLTIFEVKKDEKLVAEIETALNEFTFDLNILKENPFLDEVDLLPAEVRECADKIAIIENEIAKIKSLETEAANLKESLKNAMEKCGITKWETPNGTKVTLVAGTDGKSERVLDTEKLLKDKPKLLDKYGMDKAKKGRSSYLKITPKKAVEE